MLFFERDIAVDLGTMTTLIFVRGRGITLREATLVAMDRANGRILRIGEDAKKMLGRTPANIVPIHPIVAGVISDYDMTARMLKEFISRITSFSLFKPRVLICVPASITGVEERAMIDAAIEAGARKVYLLESSLATAVGAGIDINKADGHLVIDIGSGTTEIAVISLGGVVECESVKTAGMAFDEAIVRYIRKKHNLLIGLRTAEELKISIGCVYPRPEVSYEEVKGRCLLTGLPRSVTISSTDMIEALEEPVAQLMEAIHLVLERTPPELAADVSQNGIVLSGGGGQIWGLDKLIEERTGITTILVDDALSCTAYGAGRMLQNLDDMNEGMINLARRKQAKI
jgi:rod shape-determining protein MreB